MTGPEGTPARTDGKDPRSVRRELRALVADFGARLREAVEARRLLDDRLQQAPGQERIGRRAAKMTLGVLPDLAADVAPYVAVESQGLTFVVPAADARKIRKGGTKEQRALRRVVELLDGAGLDPRGHVLLDCGANVGTEALAALREGFASVVALEPHPETARLLRANVALNGVDDRIRALEVALSDEPGAGRLDISDTPRKARLLAAADRSTGETAAVRVARLDDLAREGDVDPDRVGLIWMDVEGHEVRALRGATSLLDRAIPLVLELNTALLRANGTLGALPELLVPGYTHVVDLRHDGERFAPVEELASMVASGGPDRVTDLLVYRLADGAR